MKKIVLLLFVFLLVSVSIYYCFSRYTHYTLPPSPLPEIVSNKAKDEHLSKLKTKASQLKAYAAANGFSTSTCFLIDMKLPSGQKRFFVYNLNKDSTIHSGLVAHGSCNESFLEEARFSNTPDYSCSSLGKYKIGYAYNGNFGKAYKLHGLDSSNSNAFKRFVVLHAYSCVPDEETDLEPICNSRGCPMVSYAFLKSLEPIIDQSKKPILLWIFN